MYDDGCLSAAAPAWATPWVAALASPALAPLASVFVASVGGQPWDWDSETPETPPIPKSRR
eukprot:8198728-Alexandrium_andersonii.AAC.1